MSSRKPLATLCPNRPVSSYRKGQGTPSKPVKRETRAPVNALSDDDELLARQAMLRLCEAIGIRSDSPVKKQTPAKRCEKTPTRYSRNVDGCQGNLTTPNRSKASPTTVKSAPKALNKSTPNSGKLQKQLQSPSYNEALKGRPSPNKTPKRRVSPKSGGGSPGTCAVATGRMVKPITRMMTDSLDWNAMDATNEPPSLSSRAPRSPSMQETHKQLRLQLHQLQQELGLKPNTHTTPETLASASHAQESKHPLPRALLSPSKSPTPSSMSAPISVPPTPPPLGVGSMNDSFQVAPLKLPPRSSSPISALDTPGSSIAYSETASSRSSPNRMQRVRPGAKGQNRDVKGARHSSRERVNSNARKVSSKTQELKEYLKDLEMQELKASPSINGMSKNLTRTVDCMYHWEEEKQAKLRQLAHQKRHDEEAQVRGPKINKTSEILATKVNGSSKVEDRLMERLRLQQEKREREMELRYEEAKGMARPRPSRSPSNVKRHGNVLDRLCQSPSQSRRRQTSTNSSKFDELTGQKLYQPKVNPRSSQMVRDELVEDRLYYEAFEQQQRLLDMQKHFEDHQSQAFQEPLVGPYSQLLAQLRLRDNQQSVFDRLYQNGTLDPSSGHDPMYTHGDYSDKKMERKRPAKDSKVPKQDMFEKNMAWQTKRNLRIQRERDERERMDSQECTFRPDTRHGHSNAKGKAMTPSKTNVSPKRRMQDLASNPIPKARNAEGNRHNLSPGGQGDGVKVQGGSPNITPYASNLTEQQATELMELQKVKHSLEHQQELLQQQGLQLEEAMASRGSPTFRLIPPPPHTRWQGPPSPPPCPNAHQPSPTMQYAESPNFPQVGCSQVPTPASQALTTPCSWMAEAGDEHADGDGYWEDGACQGWEGDPMAPYQQHSPLADPGHGYEHDGHGYEHDGHRYERYGHGYGHDGHGYGGHGYAYGGHGYDGHGYDHGGYGYANRCYGGAAVVQQGGHGDATGSNGDVQQGYRCPYEEYGCDNGVDGHGCDDGVDGHGCDDGVDGHGCDNGVDGHGIDRDWDDGTIPSLHASQLSSQTFNAFTSHVPARPPATTLTMPRHSLFQTFSALNRNPYPENDPRSPDPVHAPLPTRSPPRTAMGPSPTMNGWTNGL